MASYGEIVKHRAGTETDTINEFTSASGVTVDGVLLKDSAVTAASGVTTSTIEESVSGSGVTVDGVLLKDSGVENAVKVQFTQQASDPATPGAGESEFYVKTDGKAYLLNPDGVVTPVGGGNTIDRVNQATHGFAVGNLLRVTGNDTYAKAFASTATGAEVVAMMFRNIDTNNFECTTGGVVDGLAAAAFTEAAIPAAGTVCFLTSDSGSGAGLLTVTEPSTVGYISKPCYVVTASGATASGYFMNMRGTTVGGTNLYTTISLNNGTATTLQNLSAATFPNGSGGFIEGFIKIDATTDYVFTFKVEFSKDLAGTVYDITYTTGAGNLPPGFVISNSGANINVIWTALTGFSSASATFSMQAAAIGAQLPLQISGANVTGPLLGGDGTAIPAGFVGHDLSTNIATSSTLSTNGSTATLATVPITKGTWLIGYCLTGRITLSNGAADYVSLTIETKRDGTMISGLSSEIASDEIAASVTLGTRGTLAALQVYRETSETSTLTLVAGFAVNGTGSGIINPNSNSGRFTVVRIA